MRERSRKTHRSLSWQALRWPVNVRVKLQEFRSAALNVRIVDISRTGCRIWAGYRTKESGRVLIHLAGFEPLKADITWSRSGQLGLKFETELHPAVVRHIIGLSEPERIEIPSPFDEEVEGPLPESQAWQDSGPAPDTL